MSSSVTAKLYNHSHSSLTFLAHHLIRSNFPQSISALSDNSGTKIKKKIDRPWAPTVCRILDQRALYTFPLIPFFVFWYWSDKEIIMPSVFAVPVFFIVFRECIETSIIVAILLSFLKQTLGGPEHDQKAYKRLVRHVSCPSIQFDAKQFKQEEIF